MMGCVMSLVVGGDINRRLSVKSRLTDGGTGGCLTVVDGSAELTLAVSKQMLEELRYHTESMIQAIDTIERN